MRDERDQQARNLQLLAAVDNCFGVPPVPESGNTEVYGGMAGRNLIRLHRGTALLPSRGFSLLELLVTVAIGLTVAGITFMSLMPLLKQSHVDNAYDIALTTLRTYRNKSIAERKRYIVNFGAPGTITVQYWAVATPVSPPPVTVATYTLPSDIQFAVQAGFPSTAATVPDGFGTGATAIDFDQGMGLGSQAYVMFMPDGTSQDRLGNLNSGVLYLTRPGELYTSRALSVFGSTGRIRGWRLYLQSGINTWVQQ